MTEIIFESDEMVIKKISERKIQVEKLVPVYIGEMLLEMKKIKIIFIKREGQIYDDDKSDYYERIPSKDNHLRKLSNKYGTKIRNMWFSRGPNYSRNGLRIVRDIESININDKELERELKLKQILE